MPYDPTQLKTDLDFITSQEGWKTPETRNDYIRGISVDAKSNLDPDAHTQLVSELWKRADDKSMLRKGAEFVGTAVEEVVKSFPAVGGAAGFAASDALGLTDTGSGTRLVQGVKNLGSSIAQRAKQVMPGKSRQAERDEFIDSLRQDIDGNAIPAGLEKWLAGDYDNKEIDDPETKQFVDALMSGVARASVAADKMGELDPEQIRRFLESDRNPARADSDTGETGAREFLADYLATRDPNSWEAFKNRVTETDQQYETRMRRATAQRGEFQGAVEAMPEGLAKDITQRAASMQESPIDLASAVLPLFRGAAALNAARAGGIKAALGGVGKGMLSEGAQEAGTSYLEDPRNTAAQIAEAGALGAVGTGVLEGGAAGVGAAMRPRATPAEAAPTIEGDAMVPFEQAPVAPETEVQDELGVAAFQQEIAHIVQQPDPIVPLQQAVNKAAETSVAANADVMPATAAMIAAGGLETAPVVEVPIEPVSKANAFAKAAAEADAANDVAPARDRASSPAPNLPPRAAESVPPRPQRQGRDTSARDAWDEQYGGMRKGGRSHNDDGSIYQPTLLDEVMGVALTTLKGATDQERLASIGDQSEFTVNTTVSGLLNDGWVWDAKAKKLVNPANPSETPLQGILRIQKQRAGAQAPVEAPVEPVEEQPASGVLLPQDTTVEVPVEPVVEVPETREQLYARMRQRLSAEERAAMEQNLAQVEDEGVLADVFSEERQRAAQREDAARRQQDLEAERQRLQAEQTTSEQPEPEQPPVEETVAPVQPVPAVEETVATQTEPATEEAPDRLMDVPQAMQFLYGKGLTKTDREKAQKLIEKNEREARKTGKVSGGRAFYESEIDAAVEEVLAQKQTSSDFRRTLDQAKANKSASQELSALVDALDVAEATLKEIESDRGMYGVQWAERNVRSRATSQKKKIRDLKERIVALAPPVKKSKTNAKPLLSRSERRALEEEEKAASTPETVPNVENVIDEPWAAEVGLEMEKLTSDFDTLFPLPAKQPRTLTAMRDRVIAKLDEMESTPELPIYGNLSTEEKDRNFRKNERRQEQIWQLEGILEKIETERLSQSKGNPPKAAKKPYVGPSWSEGRPTVEEAKAYLTEQIGPEPTTAEQFKDKTLDADGWWRAIASEERDGTPRGRALVNAAIELKQLKADEARQEAILAEEKAKEDTPAPPPPVQRDVTKLVEAKPAPPSKPAAEVETRPTKKDRFPQSYVEAVTPSVNAMLDGSDASAVITEAAGRKLPRKDEVRVVIEWVQQNKEEGGMALPSDFAGLQMEQAYMLEPVLKALGLQTAAKVETPVAGVPKKMTPKEWDNSSDWVASNRMTDEAINLAKQIQADTKKQYEKGTGREITFYRRRVGQAETASPQPASSVSLGQVGSRRTERVTSGAAGSSGGKSTSLLDNLGEGWKLGGTTVSKSGFGHWTEKQRDEATAIFKQAGIRTNTATPNGSGNRKSSFTIPSDDARRIQDEIFAEEVKIREAKKEQAKADEATKQAEELSRVDPAAKQWMDSLFGRDDFANPANKVHLSDFVTGKTTKFGGMVNPKWLDGAQAAGAVLEVGKVDFQKLKENFEKSVPLKDFGSSNTFAPTPEGERAARKRLSKAIRGKTNIGGMLDPSILKDAIAIGAFYIEGGARSFAEFSAKMIEDFGANVQKYIRPAYEALRKRTDIDTTGMDPEEGAAPKPPAPTTLDSFSTTLQEAKGEAVEALRDAMNQGKGRFKGRDITLLVTPSSRDDVMLQVTRVNNEGEPQGHQDIIDEQDFNDELNDQDNLDIVLEQVRPDIGQARRLNAFGVAKFRKPVSFNYRLRLREVGPGTVPAGFISAEGRDVSYNRPLTRQELSDFEITPIGATPLSNQEKAPKPKGDITLNPSDIEVIPEDMARAEQDKKENNERWQKASVSTEPISVLRRLDGTYKMIDGHHRLLGAMGRGETIEAKVTQETKLEPLKKAEQAPPAPAAAAEPATVPIANDPVDAQRVALGLPPIMRQTQEAYTFPQMWADAEAAMRANTERGKALVTELNDTPRNISALEDAILLRERVNRVNALDLAMVEFNAAPKGNNEAQRKAMDTAITSLTELDNALNVAGTEQGRSLNARKMLARQDYTLAKMITTLRAANDGNLSEADVAMVTRLQKQLADVQAKLSEVESGQSARLAEAEKVAWEAGRKAVLDEQAEQAKADAEKIAEMQKRRAEHQAAKKEAAEKPNKWAEIREAARARNAELRSNLYSDVVFSKAASMAVNDVIIGATYIAEGVTKLADWVTSMRGEGYNLSDKEMEQLFNESKAFDAGEELPAADTQLKTRKAKAPVIDKVKSIAADEEALDSRTVYELVVEKMKARAEASRGAKLPEMSEADLTSVIREVTADVQQYFPDITEREVRDLFSGYGKILQPSQDELSRQIRQLSALGKLSSAIEDAKAQRAPLKSGPQRDKATQAIRLQQKKLARELRMSGLEYAAGEGQLRSPLDAIKARLNNQINDLALEINQRQKIKKRPSVDYDKETESLVALRDDLKRISDEVNAPAGPTLEETVAEEMKKLDKRILELQKLIAEGQLKPKEDTLLHTAELDAKREVRDGLNETLQKMRKEAADKLRTQEDIDKEAIASAQESIAELEKKIAAKDVSRPQRRTPTETAEYQALTARKKSLQQVLAKLRESIEGKRGLSDEQRIKAATKALDASIARMQTMITSGKFDVVKRTPKTPDTPELKAKREARNALRKRILELRKLKRDAETDPVAKQIATDKKRIQSRMKKLQKRLDDGDFSKPVKKKRATDQALLDLQIAEEKLKEEWAKTVFERQLASRGPGKRILDAAQQTIHTSRSVLTSLDFSAVFRQGGFIVLGNPLRGFRNLGPMFKAFSSEEFQRGEKFRMENRENYKNGLYQQSKLFLSDTSKVNQMNAQEEAFMSRWIEKIPKGARGLYLGSVLRGSQRAYTVFLNRLRMDSFDAMVADLKKGDIPTPQETAAAAKFINTATGRGDLGKFNQAGTLLNTVYFAPRLVWSRFLLLSGQPYFAASGRTKALVLREYGKFLSGAALVYALAMLAQDEDDEPLETDPRSSDFLKIRFGDTRVDPLSGLIQATVFVSRLVAGERKTSKGKIASLRPEYRFANLFRETPRTDAPKYGSDTASDVIFNFNRTKLSPVVGAAFNLLDMKNVVGEDSDPTTEAERMVIPMSLMEMKETLEAQGIPEATALIMLQMFGMGVQTYTPGKK